MQVVNKILKEKSPQLEHAINEFIKGATMMLIGNKGENYGLVSRIQAFDLATQAGLDLVQVGEREGVPVVKIMNYGKVLYEKKKQQNEAKKNQKVIQVKEVKMRPNIGEQDYITKINQATQFFKDGKRVKFTLQFKGREASMMEDLGTRLFARISKDLYEREIGALTEEKESRGPVFWSKVYFVKEK